MGDVVNLNKFRKARKKLQAAGQAAENRTRFGQPKEILVKTRKEEDQAKRDLDGKQLD
jgi:hypothetical protein